MQAKEARMIEIENREVSRLSDRNRADTVEPQDARATLREVADDSEARSRIAVEAMRSQGLDAEIDAARPGDESP